MRGMRIDKQAGQERVQRERGKFQEFSSSSASHSRKFEQDSHRRKFFQKKRTGPQSEEESSSRTFDVGVREPQLLDLRGPRHSRQRLEGILAVDLLAVGNVELQESAERLEVLELACRMEANQK